MKDDSLYEIALGHFCSAAAGTVTFATLAEDGSSTAGELAERFGSIDDLFVDIVHGALRRLTADLLELADGDADPPERLLLMTRRMAAPAPREGRALFAIVRAMLDGYDRGDRAFERSCHHGFEAFLRVMGEAQFRGKLAPLPPRFIMTVLASGVLFPQIAGLGKREGDLQGVHSRDEVDPNAEPRSALLAASIEAVFNGILTEPIELEPRPPVH